MPAQEQDHKETARALYGALKDLMDLFKSGKIALPAVDFTPAAVELAPPPQAANAGAVGNSASLLPPETQAALYIIMVVTKAEAVLEALQETYYDDTTASS